MCITHNNIHTCGHTTRIDMDICRAHIKAMEVRAYIEGDLKPPSGVKVDVNVLRTLLSEWRKRCAGASEERARRTNYKCGSCLEEMLKSTGLDGIQGADEGVLVTRMDIGEDLAEDQEVDRDDLVTRMELTGL